MRFMKMTCALAVVGFYNVGCQTLERPAATDKTASNIPMAAAAPGANDAELPVGCAPANHDPAVSMQTMGHATYETPGCSTDVTTTAAVFEDEGSTDEDMTLGDEALPPLAEVPADTAEGPNQDIVEGEGGTPCGLNVVALSSGAVGDPCMTTEGVIEALQLPAAQREQALTMVSDARTMFGDQAIAH